MLLYYTSHYLTHPLARLHFITYRHFLAISHSLARLLSRTLFIIPAFSLHHSLIGILSHTHSHSYHFLVNSHAHYLTHSLVHSFSESLTRANHSLKFLFSHSFIRSRTCSLVLYSLGLARLELLA